MTADVRTNKVRNEEFKIWKKSIPSLYQHISSLQPTFISKREPSSTVPKTVTFTDKLAVDKKKGLLTTSLYYSLASDVYEVDVQLPLGTSCSGSGELPLPNYDNFVTDPVEPIWSFDGDYIIKLVQKETPNSNAIAMTEGGSLAWFKEGTKAPLQVFRESTNVKSVGDFALQKNGEKVIVKTQPRSIEGDAKAESYLKLVDNSNKVGELIRTYRIPNTMATHTVKFHNSTLFSSCSDDNQLRFWDTRTGDTPVWTMNDAKDGTITSYDVSSSIDTLFVTGSETGTLKLWDLRSTLVQSSASPADDSNSGEIVSLFQTGKDPVVDVQFSPLAPEKILSVGETGNVYHWDLEYLVAGPESTEDTTNADDTSYEDLQDHFLKFLHTGGGRRTSSQKASYTRRTVAQHSRIRDIVATVDEDGFLTVYKGFYGRDAEIEDSE